MRKLAAVTTVAFAVPLAAADSTKAKTSTNAKGDPEEDDTRSIVDRRRATLPAAPKSVREYDGWKAKLTASQRQSVERFCRVDARHDFEMHCGGIGIHRIPAPPPLTRAGVTREMYATWQKNLSRVQRAYFDDECSNEDHAYSQLCGGTPLVIAFDNQQVMFASSGAFTTDWPTASTPWLALDRDGDGAITSGEELFGDATVLPDGSRAKHGFAALAALDANGDGRIDRADPMFASLMLWADHDGDRTSGRGELTPASRTIDSLDLGFRSEPHCDARLNCQRERAGMQWRDASGAMRSGAVVDVYLHHR